jgi:hypothetical protein
MKKDKGERTGRRRRAPNLSQDDEAITGHRNSREKGKHHIIYFQRK